MKGPSPLLGYNNNVRHKGRVFHIQTEDSGIRHPHVITHLFMDGGRIVKSLKTSYAQYVDDENGHEHVRALMKQQHQAMFRDLRDGKFDYALTPGAAAPPSSRSAASMDAVAAPASADPAASAPPTKTSVATQAAISTAHTEPAPPPAAPAPSSADIPIVAIAPAAAASPARLADPGAQTLPDLRAVATGHKQAPPSVATPSSPSPSPTVRSSTASATAAIPPPAPTQNDDEPEPSSETSSGDAVVFTALDAYDPEPAEQMRRRTPPPRSDLPPPPAATLRKARPDGVYRSQPTPAPPAAAPLPTPPPPARSALGSRPAASRPPVGAPGAPSSSAPAPSARRSLFGDDYVSEKSLDEVILSYLAEDLDTDK